MYLKTTYFLEISDDITITEDQEMKIFLENGEILIGRYQSSDYIELCISRDNEDIWIDFEDIKNIEVVG